MRDFDLKGFEQVNSAHYKFYFRPETTAARDIEKIIGIQEECFIQITTELGVTPDFPLCYVLCETPEEVGRIYGDNEPCNGFADTPDTVFAVYTETCSCIGPHEDTHLISRLIANPKSVFIREGLAMYMDKAWWGKPNEAWVAEFIVSGQYISLENLFDNESFWEFSDEVTYPIAGAFTLWLIEQMGMEEYLNSIYQAADYAMQAIESLFHSSISSVEQSFLNWISKKSKSCR